MFSHLPLSRGSVPTQTGVANRLVSVPVCPVGCSLQLALGRILRPCLGQRETVLWLVSGASPLCEVGVAREGCVCSVTYVSIWAEVGFASIHSKDAERPNDLQYLRGGPWEDLDPTCCVTLDNCPFLPVLQFPHWYNAQVGDRGGSQSQVTRLPYYYPSVPGGWTLTGRSGLEAWLAHAVGLQASWMSRRFPPMFPRDEITWEATCWGWQPGWKSSTALCPSHLHSPWGLVLCVGGGPSFLCWGAPLLFIFILSQEMVHRIDFFPFYWIYWGWHWLTKLCRFQGYNPITHIICVLYCVFTSPRWVSFHPEGLLLYTLPWAVLRIYFVFIYYFFQKICK